MIYCINCIDNIYNFKFFMALKKELQTLKLTISKELKKFKLYKPI